MVQTATITTSIRVIPLICTRPNIVVNVFPTSRGLCKCSSIKTRYSAPNSCTRRRATISICRVIIWILPIIPPIISIEIYRHQISLIKNIQHRRAIGGHSNVGVIMVKGKAGVRYLVNSITVTTNLNSSSRIRGTSVAKIIIIICYGSSNVSSACKTAIVVPISVISLSIFVIIHFLSPNNNLILDLRCIPLGIQCDIRRNNSIPVKSLCTSCICVPSCKLVSSNIGHRIGAWCRGRLSLLNKDRGGIAHIHLLHARCIGTVSVKVDIMSCLDNRIISLVT